MSHTNLLVTPTGVESGEAVINGNCPDTLVMETECLNAALLYDGPQTNSSIRTSRQQTEERGGEGKEGTEGEEEGMEGERRGREEKGRGGEERVLAPSFIMSHQLS